VIEKSQKNKPDADSNLFCTRTLLNISMLVILVLIIYTTPDKSTKRKQLDSVLDSVLDSFDDTDLIIIQATADGISKAKEAKQV